jgi:hypothetical protein
MTHADSRALLVDWVLERGKGLTRETLAGDTPLLERRHLTSLQLPELLLFLEALRDAPIDVTKLCAGDLQDIDTICDRYLAGTGQESVAAA